MREVLGTVAKQSKAPQMAAAQPNEPLVGRLAV